MEAWRSEWPEAIKRALVRNAIQVQRQRGTLKSVRDTVASFGGAISIREWWQTAPKGTPHTFELVFTMTGQDGEQVSAAFVQDVMAEVCASNRCAPISPSSRGSTPRHPSSSHAWAGPWRTRGLTWMWADLKATVTAPYGHHLQTHHCRAAGA